MSSYFLSLPLNFNQTITDTSDDALSGPVGNMIDGVQDTFWSMDASTGNVRFNLGTNSVTFDAYFIIAQNLGGYTASGLTAQSAPMTVDRQAASRDSIQYAFHTIMAQSNTMADFNWTSRIDNSTPLRIYEFWILKQLLNVSDDQGYRQIDQSLSYRGARIQEALDGTRTRTRPLGNSGKWSVAYEMNVLENFESRIQLINNVFFENPNFTHVVDYPTHPDRIYRAHLLGEGVEYNYISSFTGSGSTARFTIEEQ